MARSQAETSKSWIQKALDPLQGLSAERTDDRLLLAGASVFFLFASFVSFMVTEERDSMILEVLEREILRPSMNLSDSMIYPVLLEQDYAAPVTRPEKAALSDVNAGGSGGLTEKYGFHTLSSDDVLQVSYGSAQAGPPAPASPGGGGAGQNHTQGAPGAPRDPSGQSGTADIQGFETGEGPAPANRDSRQAEQSQTGQSQQGQDNSRQATTGQQGQSDRATESLPMRIPANYRFQNDFALRYNQSASLSIPRRELEGYKYFRDLLRQVRTNFAPPGLNLAYRDAAGTVISQPIKPQVVRVLFLIDRDGTVRDTRVVSSMGQQPVDQACVRSLEGHNFGPPPPEIFKHGNIFGISFIFPAVMNR